MTPSATEVIKIRKVRIQKNPRVKAKDVLQTGTHILHIEAATYLPQSSNRHKVLGIERLCWQRFNPKTPGAKPRRGNRKPGDISYRLGYFVVNRGGEWQWGQYALMIPAQDLDVLLDMARKEGTLR